MSTRGTVIISTRAGSRVKRAALRTWEAPRWDAIALAAVGVGAALRALWILVLHHPFATQYASRHGARCGRRARPWAAAHSTLCAPFSPPGTLAWTAFRLAPPGAGRAGFGGAAFLWWFFSSLTPIGRAHV